MTRTALTIALLLFSAIAGVGQRSVAGRVIEVIDGKTLILATDGARSTVELQYIEVPAQQPMSGTIKDHLRLLAIDKNAVYSARLIRDDRSAGVLEIGGVDLAGQMLRDGAAWHVPTTLTGQPAGESEYYSSLETAARNERRGIWANAGLKPPWESPVKPPVSSTIAESERRTRAAAAPRNPRLGDTGFLLNAYDPASRTGYVSTSLMGVSMPENAYDAHYAVDISYYYKEDEQYKRTGSYVLTFVSSATKPMFDKNNSIVVYGGGSPITMPVAKRTVTNYNGYVVEKMLYRLDRTAIDRLLNNDAAFIKIRDGVIVAAAGRYWLYALLQVTH